MKKIFKKFENLLCKMLIKFVETSMGIRNYFKRIEMEERGWKFKTIPGCKKGCYAITSPTIEDLDRAQKKLDEQENSVMFFLAAFILFIIVSILIKIF